jgi:hypothetical protein
MKSIRNIAFSVLLTLGAFSAMTYTACNKDECKDVVCQNGGTCAEGICTCPYAYEGTNCETQLRAKYNGNIYVGDGVDNEGDTYTGWKAKFTNLGTDATKMTLDLTNSNGAAALSVNVTLNSKTTFTIDTKNDAGTTITGNGTISETAASVVVNLNEVATSTTLIITFANLVKQ